MIEGMPGTDVLTVTAGQPLCAGLVLRHHNRLVFTLAKPHRWARLPDGRTRIDVMCVGGGQEPGETPLECAVREAAEETGSPVALRSAAYTWWLAPDGTQHRVTVADAVAPVFVEVRPGPRTAYRPGLPVGPWLYVVHYLADLIRPVSAGDVPAHVEVSVEHAARLRDGVRVEDVPAACLTLHQWRPIPADAVLVVVPNSPEWRIVGMGSELFAITTTPGD